MRFGVSENRLEINFGGLFFFFYQQFNTGGGIPECRDASGGHIQEATFICIEL